MSLREVIENSKKIFIVPVSTPVHYFICDSSGNIGIFEFLNGKLIIHQGEEITIPVCSNMIYEKSKSALKMYKDFGGTKTIPTKWESIPDIIAIANSKIIEYKKNKQNNPFEYGFEILEMVGSPERTQWSVIYDIKNMKIYFKSLSNKEIRSINFYDFNYDCSNAISVLEIQASNNSIPIKSQFFNITKDYYLNYKSDLIDWFKTNIKNFPDIPNKAIKYEVDSIFQRECKY
jgi:choloylglycine hydrolase